MTISLLIAGGIIASIGTGVLSWLFDRKRWNRHPDGRMGDLRDRLISSAAVGLAVPLANEIWRWPEGVAIAAVLFLLMILYSSTPFVRAATTRLNRTRYPAEAA